MKGQEFPQSIKIEFLKDSSLAANEYLIKYGKDKLKQAVKQARPYPLENVTTFKDIENDVTDFVKNGFKAGYQIGLSNFDQIFSTYLQSIC